MENLKVWREIDRECIETIALVVRNSRRISDSKDACLVNHTISKLLWRMLKNLKAIQLLTNQALHMDGSTFLKLPFGLLLRNCLMDGITGLKIAKDDENTCKNLTDLWNRNYVKSMHEEYDVYRDKLVDSGLDDDTIKGMYALAIEDTFLGELDLDKPYNATPFGWDVRECREVYEGCKRKDGELKTLKDDIMEDEQAGSCAATLYSYYKYFSQYEHYSDWGNGDACADFGHDNINFCKAFHHLRTCLVLLINRLG